MDKSVRNGGCVFSQQVYSLEQEGFINSCVSGLKFFVRKVGKRATQLQPENPNHTQEPPISTVSYQS
jgi:hypothetical protein